MARISGTVISIKLDKGFFWLSGSDQKDYFALASELPDHRSIRTLVPHKTRFEFTPVERPKGPAATDLTTMSDLVNNEDEGVSNGNNHVQRRRSSR